jgi:hypothetical protein
LEHIKYLLVSDKLFHKLRYKKIFNKRLNLKDPKTFSEKLAYLKLHYNNPLQNVCADKYGVCQYVAECGYPEILKQIYRVYDDPKDIDFDSMPDKFFIQCTHTQGHNFAIDKNKSYDMKYIKRLYKILFKRKHYMVLRENCYKHIKPRVVCGEFLEQSDGTPLTDYKIYCFGGKARYIMVSYGEYEHNVRNHKFDMQWNSIDSLFKKEAAIEAEDIQRPENFDKMVEIAETLSAPFPHVRVDLYNISGRIVFGELTFYSAGGFVKVQSDEMNERIGSWIELEKYEQYMV